MSNRINVSAWSIRHPVSPILLFVVFVALALTPVMLLRRRGEKEGLA